MAKVITTELQHSGASGANITLDSSKNVTCENNLTVDGTTTLTGAVELPDDTVDIADLSASGTASSSTFLRGDNSWATAGGVAGSVHWSVERDSGTTDISGVTLIPFDLENTDSHNQHSAGVVTIASGNAGIYVLSGAVTMQDNNGYAFARGYITREPSGGSEDTIFRADSRYRDSSSSVFTENTVPLHWMGQLNVGDVIRCKAEVSGASGTPTIQNGSGATHFSGFRIA